MFWKNKIVFVLLLFVFIFGYVVFSDEVNTVYTQFDFVSGGVHYPDMFVNLTGGVTGQVIISLFNSGSTILNGKVVFVDGDSVSYNGSSLKTCKSNDENTKFGQYVSVGNDIFNLSPGNTTIKTLDLLFPYLYSGIYHGCVVYVPTNVGGAGDGNTMARKAIFLDVDVDKGETKFKVKVYPQNRSSYTVANNAGFNNSGKVLFYTSGNRGTPVASGYVGTNYDGTGECILDIPSGYYDVVYKGWQQLSSYISGIYITGGQDVLLDFTTGVNLYGVYEGGLPYMGGSGYQFAGDLTTPSYHQDNKILVADLSILYGSACGYGVSANYTLKCDVNHDGVVDSSDASIIIENIGEKDAAYTLAIPLFGGFGISNY